MSKINTSHIFSGTPQSERIDDRQVLNNAGGFVYQVSDLDRLRRFLTLGVEGGTYYVSEKKLTKDNVKSLVSFLAKDGLSFVKEVVKFSEEGRAAKQDPTLFALALAAKEGNAETRAAARAAINTVCRTPTMLFGFVGYYVQLGTSKGWGRAMRRAVANWYNTKSLKDLVYHVTKYQQRDGWSHKDLLSLAHPAPPSSDHNRVYNFIVKGELDKNLDDSSDLNAMLRLEAANDALHCKTAKECVKLIEQFDLAQEHVPSALMKDIEVNNALLKKMPLNAMVRNLGRLTAIGLIAPLSDATEHVVKALTNEVALKKARVHPFALLSALLTYGAGKGSKGSLTWTPVPQVTQALEKAFYLSFKNVESTGKRFLIAMDVSGSMTWTDMLGVPGLTPAVASAALAMMVARTEQQSHITAFSTDLVDLGITATDSLKDVLNKTVKVSPGGTDCAKPIYWALNKGIKTDVFVILTDNETWAGWSGHPMEALREYRKKVNPDAKLVVIGMQATEFTIADPLDKGSLDIAGFDTATPEILRDFSKGLI